MRANGLADLADKGGNIFAIAQDAQRIAIKLGRQQMAADILRIISNRNMNTETRFDSVIALCRKEVL